MSRFYKVLIAALLLGALALAFRQFFLLGILTGAFLAIAGIGVAFPQLSLFGNFICRGNHLRRQVALTFDDGPDEKSTSALLDLLKEAEVRVAFFCVGHKVAANSELSARIVREGHLLENHSFAHSHFTNFFSVARLEAELSQTQAAIEKNSGVGPKFFRPPMGLSNPRIFRAARNLNLKVIGWTVRSFDTFSRRPEKIVARIVRQLRPGAIILLHDGNIPADRLILTVQMLLKKLCELDYEVVCLDELLK